MSDIVVDTKLDEWEGYIREAGGVSAMVEYGKRWHEFHLYCKETYTTQGGSRFAEFAIGRFGVNRGIATKWVQIGKASAEVVLIENKFAQDYNAVYDYIRLEPEQKTTLLESLGTGELIDRKRIKALAYGHDEGDEWYTPLWLFDSLGIRYSTDVCAPADITHVTTPADSFLTEAEDGLSQPWHGTVWCNPPYSNPEPWALKCVDHNDGLLLTHIPMNAAWCATVWAACSGIRLFQAIEFVRPDGKTQRPGSWLQLAAFGQMATRALAQMTVPADVAENPRRVPSPMWIAHE